MMMGLVLHSGASCRSGPRRCANSRRTERRDCMYAMLRRCPINTWASSARRCLARSSRRIRLALLEAIPAVVEQAVAHDADRKQGQRRRNHFEYLVQPQPSRGRPPPLKKVCEPAAAATLHAAMHQSDSNAIPHTDMQPFSFMKPAVGLHADETEKCEKASVADESAE